MLLKNFCDQSFRTLFFVPSNEKGGHARLPPLLSRFLFAV